MHFASRTQLLTAKVAAAGVAFALTTASMSGCTAFTPVPKALTQTPDHERALLIADTYAAQGHTRRAEALYAEVLRARPNNPRAVAALARLAGQTDPAAALAKADAPKTAPAKTAAEPAAAKPAAAKPAPATPAVPTPPVAIAAFGDDAVVPPPPAEPADRVELLPPPPADAGPDRPLAAAPAGIALPAARQASDADAKKTSTAQGEQIPRDGWADEFFAVAAADETGLDYDLNDVIAAAYGLTAADLVATDETATDETAADETTDEPAADLPTVESLAQAADRERSTLDADAWQPAADPAAPAVVSVDTLAPDPFQLPETAAAEDWRTAGVSPHGDRLALAAHALGRDPQNAAAWLAFDENLASGDPARQTLAVLAMGELPGPCHAAVAERLRETLTTASDDEVRSAAALALGGLGPAAEPVVPVLRDILQTGAQRPADAARVSLLCLGYEE